MPAEYQISLLGHIRQLVELAKDSESLATQISHGTNETDLKYAEIGRRLEKIRHTAPKLINLNPHILALTRNLGRYDQGKFHHNASVIVKADPQPQGCNNFDALSVDLTRPEYFTNKTVLKDGNAVRKGPFHNGFYYPDSNSTEGRNNSKRQMEQTEDFVSLFQSDCKGENTCQSRATQTEERHFCKQDKWDGNSISNATLKRTASANNNDYGNIAKPGAIEGRRFSTRGHGGQMMKNGAENFLPVGVVEPLNYITDLCAMILSKMAEEKTAECSPYGQIVAVKVDQRKCPKPSQLLAKQYASLNRAYSKPAAQFTQNMPEDGYPNVIKTRQEWVASHTDTAKFTRKSNDTTKSVYEENSTFCNEQCKSLERYDLEKHHFTSDNRHQLKLAGRFTQSDTQVKQKMQFTQSKSDDHFRNEYLYDHAPLYRRRHRGTMTLNFNQFLSLRRPQKSPSFKPKGCASKIVDKEAIYKNLPSFDAGPTYGNMPARESSAISGKSRGFYQFFKRTLSLRISAHKKKSSKVIEENCYENLLLKNRHNDELPHRNTEFEQEYVNFTQKNKMSESKHSIQIGVGDSAGYAKIAKSRKSQKPTKTTKLRLPSPSSSRDSAYSSCGKKIRPWDDSMGSNVSLDLNQNSLDGWYQQGYQMEYPDECHTDCFGRSQKTLSDISHRRGFASVPRHLTISRPRLIHSTVPQELSNYCRPTVAPARSISKVDACGEISPSSIGRLSSMGSTYSCDHEGYFTSMHRDSGLWPETDFRPENGVPKDTIYENLCVGSAKLSCGSSDCHTRDHFALLNENGPRSHAFTSRNIEEKWDPCHCMNSDMNCTTCVKRKASKSQHCNGIESNSNPKINCCRGRSFSTHSSTSTVANNRSSTKNDDPTYVSIPGNVKQCQNSRVVNDQKVLHGVSTDAFDKWLLSRFQAEVTTTNITSCTMPRKRDLKIQENQSNCARYLDLMDNTTCAHSNNLCKGADFARFPSRYTLPRKNVRFSE